MSKYIVPIGWDFTVEASSAEEAQEIVARALDSALPGDGYVLGETLIGDSMVGKPELLSPNTEEDRYEANS